MSEFRLFDSPGAEVAEIVTDGSTVKPFLNAISVVDNEAKIHVTEKGLHTSLVDLADVFMGKIRLAAESFEKYQFEQETTLGANVGEFQGAIRRARKRKDDELTLSVRENELTATVSRGYDNHNVVSQSTVNFIDPDKLRDQPSLPDIDLPVNVDIDYKPFMDALDHALGFGEYVHIETKAVNQHATALYMGSETDTRKEQMAISNIDTSESVTTYYPGYYLVNMLDGLRNIDAESLHLRLGDNFPIFVSSKTGSIEVEYVVAPRISSDD